jgi:DNA-binding XRE family transcriptional regulator
METCQNIYKNSRQHTNLTQESAADFLNIAARTLGTYETGAAPAPDDVVARMMELYNDELLGYKHLLQNPVARHFLPELESRTHSEAACNMMCKSIAYLGVQTDMMSAVADGKIDTAEVGQWAKVLDTVKSLIKAGFELHYSHNN